LGLDTVELVMRCEEEFGVDLPDADLEHVRTVGDLYRLICEQKGFVPLDNPGPATGFDRLPRGTLNLATVIWSPEDIWATLVAIFVDQLQVDVDEVTYVARIHDDLRCD